MTWIKLSTLYLIGILLVDYKDYSKIAKIWNKDNLKIERNIKKHFDENKIKHYESY